MTLICRKTGQLSCAQGDCPHVHSCSTRPRLFKDIVFQVLHLTYVHMGTVPMCTLYAYLVASERLNMKLELFADEVNSRRIYHNGVDEQELFIRLIPVRKGNSQKT